MDTSPTTKTVATTTPIIARFAPSPTGFLHAGRYRTALFSYLFARHNGGKFLLRIEDTDKVRSKKEFEDNIIDSLEWLGLEYDGFCRQSDRVTVHQKYLKQLIDSGHAYISKEVPKNPGDREEVIRFKNPNKKVKFHDIIRGDIEFDTTDLGDFVIARSMDEPVFHLVVVIDDFEMGITHVIRGEDHISNTPRQILIYEAIGAPIPQYAHLPIVLAPDRSKLSGRKGALAVTEYRDRGYLPAALVNCMALVGWNAGIKNPDGSEPEIFTKDELIKVFDLSKVQKSGAIFNEEKLRSLNRTYMEKLSDGEFLEYVKKFTPEDILQKINIKKFLPLLREKIYTFGEIKTLFAAGEDGSGGELSFITTVFDPKKPLPYKKEALMWRQEKDISETKTHLKFVIDSLTSLSDANFTSFTPEKIKAVIWPYAEKIGKGNVLWPMRYALSGKDKSPDPITIAIILGKSETLKRLKMAYDAI